MSTIGGWIGVDFDGTLAEYHGWVSAEALGVPIRSMVENVKRWRSEGKEVKIFTARISSIDCCIEDEKHLASICKGFYSLSRKVENPILFKEALKAANAIQKWSVTYLGEVLPITNVKDLLMVELYDDRAVQVEANSGRIVGYSTRGNL